MGDISKTKLQEPIILYIQPLRCHCFEGMSPVVLPFVEIFRISVINKDKEDAPQETFVTLAWEVSK